MFSPTKFPCTAWYLAEDCTAKTVDIPSKDSFDRGAFIWTTGTRTLFATRDEVVAHAEHHLAVCEEQHLREARKLAGLRVKVAKIKGGAA